jgi:CRP-like cAMP-binding protein
MIRQQEYKEGDEVLPSGELGKGFCILESGTLQVIRDNKVLSEIDIVGSIFGELSEILGMKRDATIRAKTPATVRHVEESMVMLKCTRKRKRVWCWERNVWGKTRVN